MRHAISSRLARGVSSLPLRVLAAVAFLAWVVAVGAALRVLWAYENTPGPAAAAPASWPADSRLTRPQRPVLVLALHPQCPCSAATIAELARLLAHAAVRPEVYAVFVASADADDDWVESATWRAAAALPGVHVVRDTGVEARRFGARVSGQLLAYDASGRLQFTGGITGSRGHEGDNAGRTAIEAMLAGRPHARSAFVFGCFLFNGESGAAAQHTERS